MEIIKKQVSIDKCKCHKNTQLNHIEYNNGEIYYSNDLSGTTKTNYGNFVCDYKININENYYYIKYLDVINKINKINDILFNSLYCECICNGGNIVLRKYAKKRDNYTKILDINNFFNENNIFYVLKSGINENINVGNYYLLVDDYELLEQYNKWGVDKFYLNKKDDILSFYNFFNDGNLVLKNSSAEITQEEIPTVDIPLLFENEYLPDTLYYPYEFILSGNTLSSTYIYDRIENGEIFYKTKDVVVGTDVIDFSYQEKENVEYEKYSDEIEVESKLHKLIHPSSIEIAEDYNGIIKGWGDNDYSKIFKCKYIGNNEWEIAEEDREDLKCGDGEEIKSNELKYRNITLLTNLYYFFNKEPLINDIYYFNVRYKNDSENLLKLPYIENEPLNIETCDDGTIIYDYIKSIIPKENDIYEIKYIIGAISGETDSGILYKEELKYISGITHVWIDGIIEGDLYYETLDYNTNSKTIYNNEYKIETNVRIAKIIKMDVGNIFKDRYKYPLISIEGTESLYSIPKLDSDIVFNRGNGAGWEKHFKLTECNTFQDLENYGNNVFNL